MLLQRSFASLTFLSSIPLLSLQPTQGLMRSRDANEYSAESILPTLALLVVKAK